MSEPVVSTDTSSQPLARFTARSLSDLLGELRRLSLQSEAPRNPPTDTACSPTPTDAPMPEAAS